MIVFMSLHPNGTQNQVTTTSSTLISESTIPSPTAGVHLPQTSFIIAVELLLTALHVQAVPKSEPQAEYPYGTKQR